MVISAEKSHRESGRQAPTLPPPGESSPEPVATWRPEIPAGGTALTPLGPFIPLAVDGAKGRVAGSVLLTTSSTLPATMKHWSLHQAHAVAGAVGTGRGTPAPILPVSPLTIHWANVAGAILLLV